MLTLFNFTESSIGGERYLYHSLLGTPSFPRHRDVFIANEDKLHIVPYTHQMPDGSESTCYALGPRHHGFESFGKTFHPKNQMKREELILLMYGIVNTIINARKFDLFENSFVLDPQHIYLKSRSTMPYLLYLPTEVDVPLKAQFADLVLHLFAVTEVSLKDDTANILAAFKNISRAGANFYDVAAVVIQAANGKPIDKKYLMPPEVKAQAAAKATQSSVQVASKPGIFSRFFGSRTAKNEVEKEDNPFDSLDEKTILNLTDMESEDKTATLYVMDGEKRAMQIPITQDIFVMGRKRDEVDCVFEERGISRIHATIAFIGAGYVIEDNGSSGGTFVNGVRLAHGQPWPLRNGDEVRLYTKKLVFEC